MSPPASDQLTAATWAQLLATESMIIFHAVFLSLPSCKLDSPVSTRLRGVRRSAIERERVIPISAAGRRRPGDEGLNAEGELGAKRLPMEVPNCDDEKFMGDVGEKASDEDGILGEAAPDHRSCSTTAFSCSSVYLPH